ncbi:hypothetical protein KJQ48_08960, partial [Campylobacter jejuni]|uniref:hypothetical protein n=1 Tax=Campylobacter jejuni TaxID=197 RepID=UPI001BD92FAE
AKALFFKYKKPQRAIRTKKAIFEGLKNLDKIKLNIYFPFYFKALTHFSGTGALGVLKGQSPSSQSGITSAAKS